MLTIEQAVVEGLAEILVVSTEDVALDALIFAVTQAEDEGRESLELDSLDLLELLALVEMNAGFELDDVPEVSPSATVRSLIAQLNDTLASIR